MFHPKRTLRFFLSFLSVYHGHVTALDDIWKCLYPSLDLLGGVANRSLSFTMTLRAMRIFWVTILLSDRCIRIISFITVLQASGFLETQNANSCPPMSGPQKIPLGPGIVKKREKAWKSRVLHSLYSFLWHNGHPRAARRNSWDRSLLDWFLFLLLFVNTGLRKFGGWQRLHIQHRNML